MTQPSFNASDSSDWIERFARFGFASKGFVYATIGILAAQAAFTAGGETTDPQGALQSIVAQPFGQVLLALIAIGLAGYVLWRLLQAILDPEGIGSDAKGIAQRLGYATSGLIYAGLAFSAIRLAAGAAAGSSDGGDSSAQDWTARILSQPFGQWLVGLGGAFVIGLGFYFFYEAFSAKFCKELKIREMSQAERKAATWFGRVGITSRGIVYTIIGIFLMVAARQSNPEQARGVGGALGALAQQPYGPWLLGIVALGLILYGAYMGLYAKYRRISAPNLEQEARARLNQ
ncbi:MAG: DUF1206 domain-containing protein [Leptolyngbyaceae cyanobacterium SL_5_9]|nr:DUF1206 domain-containing protein [Leptolyngbyaceae cyanobacterium SL_5_9]NJO72368.1 DUF1206 domain-containing protein [Leptolyngbyaceae cyanobacterium RM1_406_9]